jgi:hypothetical protein
VGPDFISPINQDFFSGSNRVMNSRQATTTLDPIAASPDVARAPEALTRFRRIDLGSVRLSARSRAATRTSTNGALDRRATAMTTSNEVLSAVRQAGSS